MNDPTMNRPRLTDDDARPRWTVHDADPRHLDLDDETRDRWADAVIEREKRDGHGDPILRGRR